MASATALLLPLKPYPQRLVVPLLSTTYNLRTRWSVSNNSWMLDISDANNNLLVGSVPLVTGADLLEQYGYLELGFGLLVEMTSGPPNTVPGYGDLGVNAQVYVMPYVAAT